MALEDCENNQMTRLFVSTSIVLLFSFTGLAQSQGKREVQQPAKIFLRKGWSIQSSALVKEKGDALSKNDFRPVNWYPANVPSTVVGALVEDKVYPDPLVGQNLRLDSGLQL